jgi:hypothetical protein
VGSCRIVVGDPGANEQPGVVEIEEERLIEKLGIMEQEHHFGGWWPRADFGFNEACPIRSSFKR